MLPFIAFAPYYLAQDAGYFTEQGLDVEFVDLIQNADANAMLISGQADVSAGLLSAGLLNAMSRGAGIRVVSDKGYIDANGCANIAMFARKTLVDAGTPVTGELLKGKNIMNVPGSWNEYYTDKALAEFGLTIKDLPKTNLPSPSQLEALNSGSLDLTVNNEPWVTRFKNAGHLLIGKPVTELLPDSQSAVMLYGKRLLVDEPEVGKRFMLAYLKGVKRYNEGKTDSNIAVLSAAMKLEPALMKEMCWPAFRPDGSINTASILDFQDWAVKAGLADTALPIDEIVDTTALEAAQRELE